MNRFHETSLHLACNISFDDDCIRMIEILVQALDPFVKRTVNMFDADGKTALCRAIEKNYFKTVNFLLRYADTTQWETVLVSAVKSGNRAILITVLEVYNEYSSLHIPLLHLACKLNQSQIIEYLVEDLHLNTLSNYNREGYTPVLLAAHFGHIDSVKYLLSTSKNIDLQLQECTQARHQNILHICAEQTNPEHLIIFNWLLENPLYKLLNTEHDNNGYTPLHIACQKNNADLCMLLVNRMKPDVYLFMQDFKQRTALHMCAQVKNTVLVKILLPKTIDRQIVNKVLNDTRDIDGKTPLHLACTLGNLEVAKCFIEEFNACLTTQAENRETLIASACANGHLHVVNYLLETTDADATIRNSKGFNALDIAIVNGQTQIVRRLLECSNWRRLLKNAYYNPNGYVSTPMRQLIILMPDIAYEIIDTKLTHTKGNDDTSQHQTVYDYTFFEDQYHIRNWMHDLRLNQRNDLQEIYTNDSYVLVRNHPLLIVAQSEQIKLMEHDYCVRLCQKKFQRFGLGFFTFFCLTYTLFVILYTVIALETRHPFYYYSLYNDTINGTLIWDFGDNETICENVGKYLLTSNNSEYFKNRTYSWIIPVLYVLLTLFLVRNAGMILFSFPRIFRKSALYLESLGLILCLIFIVDLYDWQVPLKFRCPDQWQIVSYRSIFSGYILK